MKTATTVLGVITAFFLTIGVIFKTMHWPGGSIALVFSVFPLGFTFLILFLIHNMIQQNKGIVKTAQALGVVTGFIYATGILFKVQHWPGGSFVSFVGMVTFIFIFIPFYFIALASKDSPLKRLNVHSGIILLLIGLLLSAEVQKAPSKNILVSLLNIDRNSYKSILSMKKTNNVLLSKIEMRYKEQQDSFRPNYEIALVTKKACEDFRDYIEHIKVELIQVVEHNDTIQNIQFANYIDNYDIPTHYLIGSDPEDATGKITEIKQKIRNLREMLIGLIQVEDRANLNIGLLTDDQYSYREEKMTKWEDLFFYNNTLVGDVSVFSQIQLQALIAENQVLNNCMDRKFTEVSDSLKV